jgi:hypothetical protein
MLACRESNKVDRQGGETVQSVTQRMKQMSTGTKQN